MQQYRYTHTHTFIRLTNKLFGELFCLSLAYHGLIIYLTVLFIISNKIDHSYLF